MWTLPRFAGHYAKGYLNKSAQFEHSSTRQQLWSWQPQFGVTSVLCRSHLAITISNIRVAFSIFEIDSKQYLSQVSTMKRLRVVGFTTLRQASSQPISSPRHLSVPPLRHRSGSISRFSFSRAFATPSEPPKEQKDNDSSIDLDGKATQAQPSASDQVTSSKIDPPLSIDILAQAEEQQNYRERSERNPDAYKTSIERRREKFAYWGYLALPGILVGGLLILGQSWDDREAQAHPDIPQGWAPGQVYARARTRLAESLGYYTEPAFPQLLPNVDPAYKPPYTLVLSLEDLLVSSKWSRQNGWEVAKRYNEAVAPKAESGRLC